MASAFYIWSKVLSYIGQQHTEALVNTWFDDVEVVELKDDQLVLFTPNQFRKPILETQCIPYIRQAMLAVARQDVTVTVLDEDGLKDYKNRNKNTGDLDPIKQQYTFDNFVVGSSNEFAHAAALAVAKNPACTYNPLFIYGPSGLGKTHLLYAIANYMKKNDPNAKIVYSKSEDFTNEFIAAVGEGKNVEFRSKYRSADLFLMDDIQFIAGKERTQDEFFHTFNTLYEQRKQIVLTSDRAPEVISKLENRLKTRFQQGLIIDVQPPDYETRVAIIQKKADSLGLKLPNDVLSYVAENVTSNVRQLEGTVNKILAYRDMTGLELNLTNVSRAIKDMFRGKENVLPTPQLIISEISSYYNIPESVILGTARDKKTVEARQVAMYLIRTLTNLSYEDIGEKFGKDHSTVMHSTDKIENNMAANSHLQTVIKEVTENVNGKL